MNTGSLGTSVISWSQTEVDGLRTPSLDLLNVGATWRWTGVAIRVDGPQGLWVLNGAEGAADIRKRAARMVMRLIGTTVPPPMNGKEAAEAGFDDLPEQGFIVTDGHKSYSIGLINVPNTGAKILMIIGDLPPPDQDLWIVRVAIDRTHTGAGSRTAGGVICFTPNTRILTATGQKPIQALKPGDKILTRDNGPQEIVWTGHRRMTGARLYAMPHLRPIRVRAGAMATGRPDEDLIVSPQHRLLVKGAAAQALFNTSEVLVTAEDLLNDHSILVDHSLREVTYVHVMLHQHNIVWANGVETESFHPSNTAIDTIEASQREGLKAILPNIEVDPHSYGEYARRNLSNSEAAILRHELARH
jgi:hypothetical protein